MYNFKNDIFDLCTETERDTLNLFCNEINKSSAEIFIVMAHKAAQLIQVLVSQGHISDDFSQKTVVSNYALDFDCSYLIDKRIAIIDDILISGTTISFTVNKLISLGVSQDNISIITLAVDDKYFSMSFRDCSGNSTLYCNKELSDEICIDLSYKISKVFSEFGLPYNVDFPSYNSFSFLKNSKNVLYNDLFWQTNEVSNYIHLKNNINALVLYLKKPFRDQVWKRLRINLEYCTHLKIRAFIINYPNGKVECRIIPMCLFHETIESDIRSVFDFCTPFDIKINKENEIISKVRYLEYYIAHQIYLTFLELTEIKNEKVPTDDSINLLFGIETGKTVYKNITSLKKNTGDIISFSEGNKSVSINSEIISEYNKSEERKDAVSQIYSGNNIISHGYDLNRSIFYPFKWWYKTKEIPVREKLHDKPKHYINDFEEIKESTKRLNCGFSLRSIEKILKEDYNEYDLESVVSSFIDRSIDEGILVPTIYYDKTRGYVCRAYRHGEDLPFAVEDECRLLFFLIELYKKIPSIKQLNEASKKSGISEITFEKIIVLFFQMGLKKGNIFNRFLGFDNSLYIRPFLSLHGVIEGILNPKDEEKIHIYSEKSEDGEQYIQWITTWLYNNNFVSRTGEENDEHIYCINTDTIINYLNDNQYGCISEKIKNEIISLAIIISKWYNRMISVGKKKKFKENVIALTSCANEYVFASAIATEIHYFFNFWRMQVTYALSRYNSNNSIRNLLEDDENDKKYKRNISQGLNSGRDKVDWYYSKTAVTVINEVYEILSPEYKNIWSSLWGLEKNSPRSPESARDNEIEKYTKEAICFLYFFSTCYDCLIDDDYWISGKKPQKYDEYKRCFFKYADECDFFNKGIYDKLEKIDDAKNLSQKKDKFIKILDSILNYSENCVENIEDLVKEKDKSYSIEYSSSLIIDIEAINPENLNQAFLKTWGNQDSNIKTQINIIKFPKNTYKDSKIKYGVFCGGNSINSDDDIKNNGIFLLNFYYDLCQELNAKVCEIRGVLTPLTPTGRRYKFNTRKNIEAYTIKFYEKDCKKLEEYYLTETKQQLILALTDYVDQSIRESTNEKLGWEERETPEILSTTKIYSCIEVFYNKYIQYNRRPHKNFVYSVVEITNGSRKGVGFLLKYKDQVVCISCNHIFHEHKTNPITAVSVCEKNYSFGLSPKKEIIDFDYDNGILHAKDEVAILSPQWDGKIKYSINDLITFDDLNFEIEQFFNGECSCYGLTDDLMLRWSAPFRVLDSTNYNYYQTMIEKVEGKVGSGFSGGLVRSNENIDCIIGIHEGHFDADCGFIISCSEIKFALEEVYNGEG